jgi:hypothetical protein
VTLNASGPISLGGSTSGQSVNLELGQSATAQISFNDANVRTLTATTAGTALVMPTNFYGKSNSETQTVTVGTLSVKGITQWGFGTGFGSISDGTFGFISNATINYLGWINTGSQLTFQIAGLYSNSGWTKVTISGTDFLRSAATFSTSTGPDRTIWSWPSVSNPFGTTVGASVPAVFTQ